MKPVRFAVLSSGIFWQTPGLRQAGVDPDVLYYRRRLRSLRRYDVLVIPKGLPEKYLHKIGTTLRRFLEEQGGVILAFGEFRGHWLERADWVAAAGSRQIKVSRTMAEMFPCPNDCMQRRINEPDGAAFPGEFENWVFAPHGEFTAIPGTATPLAYPIEPGEHGDHPVAFLQRYESGGVLLAMTLDPDYHTYQGSDCAYCLLNMIVGWAKESVENGRRERSIEEHKRSLAANILQEFRKRRRSEVIRDIGVGIGLGVLAHLLSGALF